MKKAKKKLVDLSEDTELVGMYDKEIVDRKVNNTKLIAAKNEGIEQNKKEIVINMLKENIDIKFISKVTGMSENEILKFKK